MRTSRSFGSTPSVGRGTVKGRWDRHITEHCRLAARTADRCAVRRNDARRLCEKERDQFREESFRIRWRGTLGGFPNSAYWQQARDPIRELQIL